MLAPRPPQEKDVEGAASKASKSQAGIESHYREFIQANFQGLFAGFDEFKKTRTP
jgi:hypothetical protein